MRHLTQALSGSMLLLALCALTAPSVHAQNRKDPRVPEVAAPTPAPKTVTPAPRPSPKPAPKPPPTDWERAVALSAKKQFEQACPLFEKVAKASPDNAALWLDLSQCEAHRGRKPAAIESAQRATVVGDRAQRLTAYQTLRLLDAHMELPASGCDWLDDTPGKCEEQMWSCAYPWEISRSELSRSKGTSHTFGLDSDELDELEEALTNQSALRERLAMEWKALTAERRDERVCSVCHAQAVESAGSLVNARASTCFQQKTGHAPPPDICVQENADCDVFSLCLDDASDLARRSEGAGRSLWPEASDVIAAAHKVCDATCGTISKVRCEVLTVDACRGFVGYSCVHTERGRRPRITVGEIDVSNQKGNWTENVAVPVPVRTPKPSPSPTTTPTPTPQAQDSAKKQTP